MLVLKKQLKRQLALLFVSNFLFTLPALAATDFKDQENLAKALANKREKNMDHSAHQNNADRHGQFRGVFYGFLPCNDCTGIKATLSLKDNNSYLLVTQFAKESSREYYEKGNYVWDESKQSVLLTPTKGGTTPHYYRIENEGTLVQLNADGSKLNDDRYVLKRSDMAKSREVHIH